MHKRKFRLNILPFVIFVMVLIVWEAADYLLKIKEIILPNPHEILISIITNFNSLIFNASITLSEAILGFILGSLAAILIALSFVYVNNFKKAFYPYVIIIQATPVLALAPILILWFGTGLMSKVVMSALVAFFPVLVNAVKGFTAIEQEETDMFKSLSASEWQIFKKLRFPNSLKYIFPALKVSITFALVGAVIAEFTGASKGIGYLIVNSSYYLETSLVFAGIITVSVAGILLFYIFDWLEKKIVFWEIH